MYFISSYSYADTLLSIKSEASSQGQDYLSWNDIQNCIDMVNMQIKEENESKWFFLHIAHRGHSWVFGM